MPIPHLQSSWKSKNLDSRRYTIHRLKPFGRRQGWGKNFIKKILGWSVALGVIALLAGAIFVMSIVAWASSNLPNPDQLLDRTISESTKIYDRTGNTILYEIHGGEKRTQIKIEELPDYVKQATIAVEDKNFYTHSGISLLRIGKCAILNTLNRSYVCGGSTLTQQLVKNAILTREKTITRKAKELILSYKIEKEFNKDKILQMYFNEIPYGSVLYGIESASQTFFGKPAKSLTLGEAALLAGIPQAPTYYSPYGANTEDLFNRQKLILNLMVEQKYITEEQKTAAEAEKIIFKAKRDNILAPHFVMYIKQLLADKYGEDFLEKGGLKVITTLDIEKQKFAENLIKEQVEKNFKKYNANNAALVALDPKTGQILTMVGSADYFNDDIKGQVNVLLTKQQPGSSFKPIVYTVAFLRGLTPETVIFDLVTNFKDICSPDYKPENNDKKEHGPITLKKALGGSLNIPAVETMYIAGIDNVYEWSQKLGYSTFKDRSSFCLSAVLGGADVKPIEHALAFTTFAADGTQHELSAILKIEDKNGQAIEEFKDKNKRIFPVEPVRYLNQILSDNENRAWVFGATNYLMLNRPAAAKTGTTNDYRDGWTVGYTPNLVTLVWTGNTDNSAMINNAHGATLAGPIWNKYMTEALKNMPIETFPAPPEIVPANKPMITGQMEAEQVVKIDKYTGLLSNDLTPPEDITTKTYKTVHNILHYVSPADPAGPAPADPTLDQQYQYWEAPVVEWAKKQGYTTETPPTETDTLHTVENQPTIKITSPTNNAKIENRQFQATVEASAPRGVKLVKYFIDDTLYATVTTPPYSFDYYITDLVNGFHTLTAIAADDVNNQRKASVELNFMLGYVSPVMSWLNISTGLTVNATSFPYTFNATVSNLEHVQNIKIYYKPTSGGSVLEDIRANRQEKLITETKPTGKDFSFSWSSAPEVGDYLLYGYVFDDRGNMTKSKEITIKVQ